MLDLSRFSLREMTELGGVLRKLGDGAESMESVANRTVRILFETFRFAGTGGPSCALVRFFKTHDYAGLDRELQAFAREQSPAPAMPSPRSKCLTLLATAGERKEWNSRHASRRHKAIPLVGEELASRAPMISNLMSQLGVEFEASGRSSPTLLASPDSSSFNVFYVPDASGSPVIPDQQDFVGPAGVRSVLGFGGMLPAGDIFVVLMFSKVSIPPETVELFRTLALSVKMAVLRFDGNVFDRAPDVSAREEEPAGLAPVDPRASTLEQLLEVYEGNVLEQADMLYQEQERILLQKTLLEFQGEASIDGSLSTSSDGQILFANKRLAEMWGIPQAVAGSLSHLELLRSMAEQTRDPAEFLDRSIAADEGLESREEIRLRDGRTFDRYTAPILDSGGRRLGRVWHFHDITEFKELDRLKDDFISAVSHELRTPLTAIRASLDLMATGALGELPEEAAELAEIARRNCQRLVRLVGDVLDIEKIEAGRMELRIEPLVLAPLVARAVDSLRPYAREREVELRLEEFAPGARVRADPDRLIQVLENLIANAVRFSPAGEEVRVALAQRGPMLRVEVQDRGPGIPADQHARVFEKFVQLEAAGGSPREGTGLGLNLSRAIIEQLGGSIGFVARPGSGSLFYFDLPEHGSREGEEGAA